MSNIQLFVLAFIVLTIQTVTLIVFGFMFSAPVVVVTFCLFVLVDVCLCACVDALKIVKEK